MTTDLYTVALHFLAGVGAYAIGLGLGWAVGAAVLAWRRRREEATLHRRLKELTAPRPDCRAGWHDWHPDDAGGAVCARCGAEVPF